MRKSKFPTWANLVGFSFLSHLSTKNDFSYTLSLKSSFPRNSPSPINTRKYNEFSIFPYENLMVLSFTILGSRIRFDKLYLQTIILEMVSVDNLVSLLFSHYNTRIHMWCKSRKISWRVGAWDWMWTLMQLRLLQTPFAFARI